MPNQNSNKMYPAASEEIAKMLGLKPEASEAPQPLVSVSGLETAGQPTPAFVPTTDEAIMADVAAAKGSGIGGSPTLRLLKVFGRLLLALIPFLVVFGVALTAYYLWIADPAARPEVFNGLFERKAPTADETRAKEFAALQKSEAASFNQWVLGFYYNVSDGSVVAMDYVAPNKLTNFENYLLKLNPTTNDIRGTGKTDAEMVLAGIDPVTGAALPDSKRDIVAQYFDVTAIQSRISGVPAAEGGVHAQVAEAQTAEPSSAVTPIVPPGASAVVPASGCQENWLNMNTNVPGRLEIPTLGVNVPIMWTKDAKNFDNDLKSGVVHYPCTPLPGDWGTSYISGHSSNYSWVNADYNKVFAKLNNLPEGATFKVTVVGQNGKDIRLFYVVERKQIFAANDQAQFINTAESIIALSTCWPVGTFKERLVAYAKLDRIERL